MTTSSHSKNVSPQVSVVVPVYNRETFIAECLSSICRQTLQHIEIICIDDGSTDGSLQKLKEIQSKDSRIRIISRENRGAAYSRNEGINAATGEYVAFMDSDDFYPDATALETLYRNAKEHGVLMSGGSLALFDGNANSFIPDNSLNQNEYTFVNDGFISYREWQFDWGFTRFIYNRKMLIEKNIDFPILNRLEDPVFFVKAGLAANKLYVCSKNVYAYRVCYKLIEWSSVNVRDIILGLRMMWDLSVQHRLTTLQKYCCRSCFTQEANAYMTKEDIAFLDMMEYATYFRPNSIKTWLYSKKSSRLIPGRRHMCIMGIKFSYFRK